jgi:DNA-binding response OmpR family regulator
MARILVVEDEPKMRAGLKDNLEFEGYYVDVAENGEAGLELGLSNNYDLYILDVMMPKKSGFDVCKELRAKGIASPVIFLTAKGEEIDKVLGLELGADDYITKPFSLREFLARVKAILRRAKIVNESEKDDVIIGKLTVNFHDYTAKFQDNNIEMSHKEFETLHYLYTNKNKVVSRDELLKEVWGLHHAPTTRTVDNFIVKLRQKVEVDSNKPKLILTVHGIGYKLID